MCTKFEYVVCVYLAHTVSQTLSHLMLLDSNSLPNYPSRYMFGARLSPKLFNKFCFGAKALSQAPSQTLLWGPSSFLNSVFGPKLLPTLSQTNLFFGGPNSIPTSRAHYFFGPKLFPKLSLKFSFGPKLFPKLSPEFCCWTQTLFQTVSQILVLVPSSLPNYFPKISFGAQSLS
jgi:hypothetical protein